MVKTIALWIGVIWLALIVFAPKRELYFMLEDELAKNNIILHGEVVEENLFGVSILHPTLYVNKIEAAKIDEISLTTFLFWSVVSVKQITVNAIAKEWIPAPIEKLEANYGVWQPMGIGVSGASSFATIAPTSVLDLATMKIRIDIAPTVGNEKGIDKLKGFLKKDDKGWYYETAL